MQKATDRARRGGKWSATGDYIWRLFNHHEPAPQGQDWGPLVPDDVNYHPLPGSNELYSFRATSKVAPEITAQFVPCYCQQETCSHTHITNAHTPNHEPSLFLVHSRPGSAPEEDTAGDEPDVEGGI